jgi:hypothetical protein
LDTSWRNAQISSSQCTCPIVVRFCTPLCNGCTRGKARETPRCLGPRSPLPVTPVRTFSPHLTLSLTHRALSHQPPPMAPSPPPPPSAATPMDPVVRPTVTRSNEALLRIVREYEAGGRDSAAQINTGRVLVLTRPSPVVTRPADMETRRAAMAALHAAGIPSEDPSAPGVSSHAPRVSVGEGGGNGGMCSGLHQGDGAPSGVCVDCDARADAMGHATADCFEWRVELRAAAIRPTTCSSAADRSLSAPLPHRGSRALLADQCSYSCSASTSTWTSSRT